MLFFYNSVFKYKVCFSSILPRPLGVHLPSSFSLLLSYWLGRLDLGFILWAFQTVCIHILIIIMVLLVQVIKCMIILRMYATINKINKEFDRLQKLA